MRSVEKYLAKLLQDFFYNHGGVFSLDISKEIIDYINQNSNISFDNLYVKCNKNESEFYGFVAAKCTPKKIEFKVLIKK